MNEIVLPYNWEPRDYQKPALNAWIRDGIRHLELIWHRRAGKDDICLHGTAIKAHERVANYWHMLPQHNQVRKAIWTAVNSHTGIRRIDEAFPKELRASTNETEMFIKFKNGSTWQCLGSDNFQGAIGSAPAGIVYSEWSLSNPSASGYLRPILTENKGWELKIGTPRGKNHAYRTYQSAVNNPNQFAQLLTVRDTGMDSVWDMAYELEQYVAEFGEDLGRAMFDQEFYCSFEAAVLGSVWGAELAKFERDGRITTVDHDERFKVSTAWDIGRSDSTAIWIFQVINNEVKVLDYLENSQKDVDWFVGQLMGRKVTINLKDNEIQVERGETIQEAKHRQAYDYETHWLPHDARAKTFAAKKSVQQQVAAVFSHEQVSITPNLSIHDGLQAARKMIPNMVADHRVYDAIETIKQYRFEWDDDKQMLKDKPRHDWTSHLSDAFRYMAVAYKTPSKVKPKPPKLPRTDQFINGLELATPRKDKAAW